MAIETSVQVAQNVGKSSVSCQMSVLIHTNLSIATVANHAHPFYEKKTCNIIHFSEPPNFRRSFPPPSFSPLRFFPTNLTTPACQTHSSGVAKPHGGTQRRAVHLNENGKMHSFPPIRIPKDMGIVWETYHKGVPLLGVPENTLDFFPRSFFGGIKYLDQQKKTGPKKNGGVAKCLGRNSEEDGFFRFGKFCVLAKLPEMLKEFGYFGGGFFCWEDVFLGKTTMFNAVR